MKRTDYERMVNLAANVTGLPKEMARNVLTGAIRAASRSEGITESAGGKHSLADRVSSAFRGRWEKVANILCMNGRIHNDREILRSSVILGVMVTALIGVPVGAFIDAFVNMTEEAQAKYSVCVGGIDPDIDIDSPEYDAEEQRCFDMSDNVFTSRANPECRGARAARHPELCQGSCSHGSGGNMGMYSNMVNTYNTMHNTANTMRMIHGMHRF